MEVGDDRRMVLISHFPQHYRNLCNINLVISLRIMNRSLENNIIHMFQFNLYTCT